MKISIVVLVYNIEEYLPQALESLVGQTYRDIEVIMVNDGSRDGSGEICRQYAERYDSFHLVEQVNGGPSSARNAGMRAATGEYILFLDGDDLFHKDFVNSFSAILAGGEYDCILGRMSYFTTDPSQARQDGFLSQEKVLSYDTGKQAFVALTAGGRWFMTGVRGLYRRSFLLENGLWMRDSLRYSEDQEWTIRMLSCAGKTGINSFPGYYYRENRPGSLMNTLSLKKVRDTVEVYKEWYGLCQNRAPEDAFLNALYLQIGRRFSSLVCTSCDRIKKEEKREFYKYIKENRYLLQCTDDGKIRMIDTLSRIIGFPLLLTLLKLKK